MSLQRVRAWRRLATFAVVAWLAAPFGPPELRAHFGGSTWIVGFFATCGVALVLVYLERQCSHRESAARARQLMIALQMQAALKRKKADEAASGDSPSLASK